MLACSDDSSTIAPVVDEPSSDLEKSSSSKNVHIIDDTTTVYDTVKVVLDDTSYVEIRPVTPNYTDATGPFSWDGSLPSPSSSSAAPKSSSSTGSSPSSSSVSTPAATIDGDVMTDNRDGKKYQLVMVGEKIWMAENLAYKTTTGSYCYDGDCDNILYTFAAIESACPGGWHMPSRSEMEALAAEGSEWEYWQFGGRMSGSNFNYSGDMGFWWLSKGVSYQSGDENNCKSSNCAMLFVQKAPDYGDGENKFQQDDKTKGFSIRCVQN